MEFLLFVYVSIRIIVPKIDVGFLAVCFLLFFFFFSVTVLDVTTSSSNSIVVLPVIRKLNNGSSNVANEL